MHFKLEHTVHGNYFVLHKLNIITIQNDDFDIRISLSQCYHYYIREMAALYVSLLLGCQYSNLSVM